MCPRLWTPRNGKSITTETINPTVVDRRNLLHLGKVLRTVEDRPPLLTSDLGLTNTFSSVSLGSSSVTSYLSERGFKVRFMGSFSFPDSGVNGSLLMFLPRFSVIL